MSVIGTITMGVSATPLRMIVYGEEGIGKSTFAAAAPKPVFIQTESGLGQIDCAKFPVSTTYQNVIECMKAIIKEDPDFDTVVIDSLDWLEKLVWEETRNHPENQKHHYYAPDVAYGAGYSWAMKYWLEVSAHLQNIHASGRNVILLAHSEGKNFKDPERESYHIIGPAIHNLPMKLFNEWVDAILYAHTPISTKTETVGFDDEKKRHIPTAMRDVGGGLKRQLRCIRSAGARAKNRYNMPEILPLDWPTVAQYFGDSLIGKKVVENGTA